MKNILTFSVTAFSILALTGLFGLVYTQKLFSLECRSHFATQGGNAGHIKTLTKHMTQQHNTDRVAFYKARSPCSPEVVEVVELGRGQQRQVVAAVGDGGAEQSQAVPQAGGGQVGAQDHWPDQHRQRV